MNETPIVSIYGSESDPDCLRTLRAFRRNGIMPSFRAPLPEAPLAIFAHLPRLNLEWRTWDEELIALTVMSWPDPEVIDHYKKEES